MRKSVVHSISILAGAAISVCSLNAHSQDVSADPYFDTIRVSSNFLPDPKITQLVPGGNDDASHLGSGCAGYINNEQPDVDLVYTGDGEKLMGVFAQGSIDTTLVINAPSGQWYCNDDFADFTGTNPGIVFPAAETGYYNIWVGTFEGGVGDEEVSLLVSEYEPEVLWGLTAEDDSLDNTGLSTILLESGQLGKSDTTLSTGEYADVHTFQGSAGDSVTVALQSSEFDTYLLVTSPDDEQFENDDFEGSQDESLLSLVLPESGEYRVIATSYESGETGEYTLSVTGVETTPNATTQSGELRSGDNVLSSGEFYDSVEITGVAGQTARVALSSSEFDTYLIVQSPEGETEENDDSSGSDSFLEYTFRESGVHNVVVTSYEEGETGAYELSVEVVAATSDSAESRDVSDIGFGESRAGRLEVSDQQLDNGEYSDMFSFSANAGDSVRLRLASQEFDTYLGLLTPDGEEIQNDDFNGSTSESVIEMEVRQSGRFRVFATSYEGGETGGYELSLERGSALAGAVTATAGRGRIYGVFAGIADYPGTDNDLFYTDQDATRARDALINGAGMRSQDAITLVDGQATRENFISSVRDIAARIQPEDTFVLFYSGHGAQVPRSDGFEAADPDGKDETIMLYDAMLSDNEMNTLLAELGDVRSLIVLDACFSGGFAKDIISVPGRMGLFSSEEDVTSQVASKFRAGGYLSVFFEEAISGDYADYDDSGDLTAIELSQYLHDRFRSDVKSAGDEYVRTAGPQSGYQHLVVDRGSIGPYEVLFGL